MVFRKLLICITVICFSFGFSQSNETAKLLRQSENQVFTYPDEAIKTINFLIKSGKGTGHKPKLYLLLAKANYAKGAYDFSLTNSFEAEKLAREEGNKEVQAESLMIISLILDYLQLNNEVNEFRSRFPQNEISEIFLKYENTVTGKPEKKVKSIKEILKKIDQTNIKENQRIKNISLNHLSRIYLDKSQLDSAVYYSRQAVVQTRKDSLGGYFLSKSLLSLGNVYFLKKENREAGHAYEQALIAAKNLHNPFLEVEIHRKLSANYLAAKNTDKFYFHNQQASNLQNLADQNENNAANTAYQLLSGEQDSEVTRVEKNLKRWLFSLCSVLAALVIARVFLYYRNKSKLKTYETLLGYLKKQKNEAEETKSVATENRSATILKESEDHILLGLKKFESSKKFTNKEMSLGMLAAQLNTNTKYLSEIINRHKQKNFNSYINELRINYITGKIKNNPNYLNYKVSYLAEEAGFSSHSTFTTVFKTVVGVSPIAFVEFVRKQKENTE